VAEYLKIPGIGKATAIQYAADGCKRLLIADLQQDELKVAQEQIQAAHSDVAVKFVVVDVRSQESVQAMVNTCIEEFGRIDYCVNCAGIIRFGDTVELDEKDFELVYQVNLRGIFFCAKAEITAMLKQEPLVTR
jgi:NAD(P)-dependent dehydrogenase (short-subunit alcohol dehydrogenase family)